MRNKNGFKILTTILRWTIAAVGIWWVLSNISWRDQATVILPGKVVPQDVTLVGGHSTDTDKLFTVIDPHSRKWVTLAADRVFNSPASANQTVDIDHKRYTVLAIDPGILPKSRRLFVMDKNGGDAHWTQPGAIPNSSIDAAPKVEFGVLRLVRNADLRFLLAAVLVIPLTFIITSYRWNEIMRALEVRITLSRTFVLNMVGLFYNTFMPGSTGGDLLKAVYVARQTQHRTRAVMSVLIDRIIGLLALIILGGLMATWQWHNPICLRVAMISGLLVLCTGFGAVLIYSANLRVATGLEFILSRLPMQKQIRGAIEAMHILMRRPGLVMLALLMSFPVHIVVIISAMLAGFAFGLPIHPIYYWMAVPVIVLAGAIPISPQGAGVMEYFAYKLLAPQGATLAQALALTMSIRLVQILWNLTGGFFVLRGGYHTPTEAEKTEITAQDIDSTPKLAASA